MITDNRTAELLDTLYSLVSGMHSDLRIYSNDTDTSVAINRNIGAILAVINLLRLNCEKLGEKIDHLSEQNDEMRNRLREIQNACGSDEQTYEDIKKAVEAWNWSY